MANSATVAALDDVLATQYNNLRADVLNTATGHLHDGTNGRAHSTLAMDAGGIINFNSGNVTVTHSANALAFAGASSGYTFDAPVSATRLTLTSAASVIVPGATSLSLRNNANTADNLILTDAGVATIRAGLTVSAGALVASATEGHALGVASSALRQLYIAGSSTAVIGLDIGSTLSPAAGNAGSVQRISATINKASSGTHAIFAGLRLDALAVGAGAATLTETATLYIGGATGANAGATNNAIHVAGGTTLLDGALTVSTGGATITGTVALGSSNLTTTGTISATGARVTQSYHTNITSTNAVTVDSSIRSKVPDSVADYTGNAVALLSGVRVVSYRHLDALDPTKRQKLGVIAETLCEPLAVQEIDDPMGGVPYPGVNLMGLAALQIRAIQQLSHRLTEVERRLSVAA